jgi:hypothetical protein
LAANGFIHRGGAGKFGGGKFGTGTTEPGDGSVGTL